MPLDIPEDDKKIRVLRKVPEVQEDALSPKDTIEYGITEEVSPGPGRKAWVKFGTTSAVRDGETTEAAKMRVVHFVNTEIDNRINELK